MHPICCNSHSSNRNVCTVLNSKDYKNAAGVAFRAILQMTAGIAAEELITDRNEVVAKVIFLHLFVIQFTGVVCLSAWWDTIPPRADPPGQTPWSRHSLEQTPQSRHPPEQTPQSRHPGSRHPREQTPPHQSRHLPTRADPPRADNPPPRVDTPQSRSPWEADSGIWSMSGQYASYWNAFLLRN